MLQPRRYLGERKGEGEGGREGEGEGGRGKGRGREGEGERGRGRGREGEGERGRGREREREGSNCVTFTPNDSYASNHDFLLYVATQSVII